MFNSSYSVSHRSLTEFAAVVVEFYGSSVAVQDPTHLYSRRDGKVTIRARDPRNTVTVSLHRANVRAVKGNGEVVVLQSTGPQSVMHKQALLRNLHPDVLAAAALLDTLRPDWDSRVNLDTLNMRSMEDCILGQVFADAPACYSSQKGFGRGLDFLDRNGHHSFAYDHPLAFSSSSPVADWKALILSRRA